MPRLHLVSHILPPDMRQTMELSQQIDFSSTYGERLCQLRSGEHIVSSVLQYELCKHQNLLFDKTALMSPGGAS